MKISYIDNIFILSYAFVQKDYSSVKKQILDMKEELSYRYEERGEIYGYRITRNEPVSNLYGFDAYVVRFYFSEIETLHDEHQEAILTDVFEALDREMKSLKGYYNLRLPAHVVDAIRAFNKTMKGGMFCGGTVEQIINGKKVPVPEKEGIKSFFIDEEYQKKHREELMEMTYSSFSSYQGQYHISSVTGEKAGIIYENWIKGYFDNFEEKRVYVAEYMDTPIGFMTIGETDRVVEAQLSAVDSNRREFGVYRTLISSMINYAYESRKVFVTSTQFDNYIVQGIWNSLGLKPYFSFYNYHFDLR